MFKLNQIGLVFWDVWKKSEFGKFKVRKSWVHYYQFIFITRSYQVRREKVVKNLKSFFLSRKKWVFNISLNNYSSPQRESLFVIILNRWKCNFHFFSFLYLGFDRLRDDRVPTRTHLEAFKAFSRRKRMNAWKGQWW